jgi:hypothetical protein
MTCQSNVFCIQTCRMCMKDELVDLPALGCHVLLYYEHMNLLCTICGHGVWIMHLLWICDLLCMYLWSIMLNLWSIMHICCCDATAVGIVAYILVLYFMCRDSSKCRTKWEKTGPLPCASTRQWNLMSYAVCLHTANMPRVDHLWCSGCWPDANLGSVAHGIGKHTANWEKAHGKPSTRQAATGRHTASC